MNKIFNILGKILFTILVVLTLFCFYTILELKIKNKPYANYFGYTILRTASGSMGEAIELNDIIVVKLNDTNNLKVGDIITYLSAENVLVTHRILSIENDKFITKGDANNTTDNPVDKNEIIGKVVGTIFNINFIFDVLNSPLIFITLSILFILIGLYSYISKRGDDNE